MLEVEVKMISRESVKPSKPTPTHLRTFNLSMLDQKSRLYHVASLMFYNNNNNNNNNNPNNVYVDITGLKSALSQTLVDFYPLAGRCKDESTIICNDEGVVFTEAHVNCTLSALLGSSKKLELFTKFQFFPPKDILYTGEQHISELVHLAFQVNVFSCGRVVIGSYVLHKIMDGTSSGLFFKQWSALARNSYGDLIQPDFDSTVIAFPPNHPGMQEKNRDSVVITVPPTHPGIQEKDHDSVVIAVPPKDSSLKVVVKGFTFSDVALTKLKAMAATKNVLNPTRFESVLGFIWEQCLAAESTTSKLTEVPVLIFRANIRKRVGAPLSENSIGNIVALPCAVGNIGLLLPELAAEIHGEILKLMDETVKEDLVGWDEAILALQRQYEVHYSSGYKKGTYFVTSVCRSGLSEADFGFGKPSWIVYPFYDGEITRPLRNFISLADYNHPDGTNGTVAWIYLEEKEMQVLESNQQFLAFASPW